MYFFEIEKIENAGMAKLVDALDLGSSGATHQSSSLCTRTKAFSYLRVEQLSHRRLRSVAKWDAHAVLRSNWLAPGFRFPAQPIRVRRPVPAPKLSVIYA